MKMSDASRILIFWHSKWKEHMHRWIKMMYPWQISLSVSYITSKLTTIREFRLFLVAKIGTLLHMVSSSMIFLAARHQTNLNRLMMAEKWFYFPNISKTALNLTPVTLSCPFWAGWEYVTLWCYLAHTSLVTSHVCNFYARNLTDLNTLSKSNTEQLVK